MISSPETGQDPGASFPGPDPGQWIVIPGFRVDKAWAVTIGHARRPTDTTH